MSSSSSSSSTFFCSLTLTEELLHSCEGIVPPIVSEDTPGVLEDLPGDTPAVSAVRTNKSEFFSAAAASCSAVSSSTTTVSLNISRSNSISGIFAAVMCFARIRGPCSTSASSNSSFSHSNGCFLRLRNVNKSLLLTFWYRLPHAFTSLITLSGMGKTLTVFIL